jgi:hypothetical protein
MRKNNKNTLEEGCFYLGFNGDLLYHPINKEESIEGPNGDNGKELTKEKYKFISYLNEEVFISYDGNYLGEKLLKIKDPHKFVGRNYKKLEWIEDRLKQDKIL